LKYRKLIQFRTKNDASPKDIKDKNWINLTVKLHLHTKQLKNVCGGSLPTVFLTVNKNLDEHIVPSDRHLKTQEIA
jgi:hypothetical protein